MNLSIANANAPMGCEAEVAVVFDGCGACVDVSSDKDLSNVVLLLCDGTEYKHDNLSVGQTGTFCSPDGQNVLGAWVKSGCNSSGDGPGYGEFVDGPCESGNCDGSLGGSSFDPLHEEPGAPELDCPSGFIALGGDFHSQDNSGSVSGLFPFSGTEATFEYELIGANPGQHPRWNYGVGSENNSSLAPDGDYIKVQVRNSGFPDGDRARYRLVFSTPVYDLEFKWGGNDHSDRISVVAENEGAPVATNLENVSIPGNDLSWVGDNGLISDASAGNAPDNAVRVFFDEPVTELTIEAAKHNNTHSNVTMQLYELRYCVPKNTTSAQNDINHTLAGIPVAGQVLSNDSDIQSDAQSVSLVSGPPASEGSLTLHASGSYVFTPAPGFHGVSTFTYRACDDAANTACDEAEVSITVMPEANTQNAGLIAFNDNMIFPATGVNGRILDNDHDWNGSELSVSDLMVDTDGDGIAETPSSVNTPITVGGRLPDGQTTPQAGELTVQADGSFTFLPAAGFNGKVTAQYTASNTFGQSTGARLDLRGCGAKANCTYSLDDLRMTDKNVTARGNLLSNDWDAQGDAQSVGAFTYDADGDGHAETQAGINAETVVGGVDASGNPVAQAGSLTVSADGSYTFVPATDFVGNVYVPYEVVDAQGATSKSTLTISVLESICDFSDAPEAYGLAMHRGYTDANQDGVPDGLHDVWLGAAVSAETDMAQIVEDQHDDGMVYFSSEAIEGNRYAMDLEVHTNMEQEVHYGVWVDYNNDELYDEFVTGSRLVDGAETVSLEVPVPEAFQGSDPMLFNIRTRIDDQPFTFFDYQGLRTNGEVEDYQMSFQPMPVEMMYFEGESKGCELVVLEWGTASEEQNSHFEVERSVDGKEFEKVGRVEGNGDSAEAIDYRFLDETPSKGALLYYRLKQVDFDGGYEYSDIITVEKDCDGQTHLEMKAYPNPTLGRLQLELSGGENVGYEKVMVSNASGQHVAILTPDAGSHAVELDLTDYPVGFYVVTCLLTDGTTQQSKVFKQ